MVQAHIEALTQELLEGARGLHAVRHVAAARLRAVQVPERPLASMKSTVTMSFLAPLFALALAGLAIPVLLHLTQTREEGDRPLPVADVRAADSVPGVAAPQASSTGCCCWCGMAALALIIAAFARPLWNSRRRADRDRPGRARGGGAARYQLQHGLRPTAGSGGGRRARRGVGARRARSRRRSCSSRRGPRSRCARRPSTARSTAPIDAAKPGASATRYAPAIKVAGSILAESQLPRREVVLISDFQRAGWRGAGGHVAAGRARR